MELRTANNLHFGLPRTGALLKNSLDKLAAMQPGRQWLQCESDMLTLTITELETFTPLHQEAEDPPLRYIGLFAILYLGTTRAFPISVFRQ